MRATEGWRQRLYVVIFEAETPAGKAFDVGLILAILASVAVVMLESVGSVRENYGDALVAAEWTFTLLFTAEYLARIACARRPTRYMRSFFGVVDLLAVLPTYLGALFPGAQSIAVVRVLRLLRVFRVLKLAAYVRESNQLMGSLLASRRKITVFLFAIFSLTVILGSMMYLIEGPEHGFDSIPRGVYWAIVTLTTVGYGDISPETPLGQALASVVMVMGYGVIAVPTGIVTAELTVAAQHARRGRRACPSCGELPVLEEARFCHGCGNRLDHPE